ncbi:MAG: ABC transporter permease [Acidobacteriota bacterium]|nr:ABC transporter permease [Acidobacteriota bacterium]
MRTEFRYALRSLARDRGFALTVILSLALGIGANTAIFTLIDGILVRPPDYREPERLVTINQSIPMFAKSYPELPTNIAIFKVWQQRLSTLESVAIAQPASFNLTGAGQPEQLRGVTVSAGWLRMFGAAPMIGRDFTAEEEQHGRDQVVLIGESLWRRRFRSDPAIAGRKILLDGKPFDVAGVVPASYVFPVTDMLNARKDDKPVEIYRTIGYEPDDLKVRLNELNYWTIGRLKPGITLSRAQAELNVVEADVDRQMEGNFHIHANIGSLMEGMTGHSRQGLLLVMAAVGAVLLVLVVNLANLSLARAAARGRDAAIRTALGADQGRLVRQSLLESLLLASGGGTLGVLLAWWGVHALVAEAPVDLPRLHEIHMDWRVLLFALGISLIAGALFGVLPALHSARTAPIDALKSGGRSNTAGRAGLRVRSLLVAVEVGLSAALLVVAGLLIASFTRVMNVDRGFQVDRVLAVDVSLLETTYKEPAQRTEFFDRLLSAVAALPGVRSAAATSTLPLTGENWIDLVEREKETRPPTELPTSNVRFISPGYFSTLGIALREGRPFEDRDRQTKVVILSASLARRLWGDASPLGRRLKDNDTLMQVVGVTPDLRSTSLDHDPVNVLYIPYWQRPRLSASIVVRTALDPRLVANAVRSAVWKIDGEATIPNVRTLQEVMAQSVGQRHFQMLLVGLFALAAMGLAGIGTYGVLAYAVARRTSEIGVRMALGAGQPELLGMVLRQGMRPVFAGLAAGAAVALAVGRFLESLLYQVSPRDPAAFAAAGGVLMAVSAAACLIPALRATRVNPLDALRSE